MANLRGVNCELLSRAWYVLKWNQLKNKPLGLDSGLKLAMNIILTRWDSKAGKSKQKLYSVVIDKTTVKDKDKKLSYPCSFFLISCVNKSLSNFAEFFIYTSMAMEVTTKMDISPHVCVPASVPNFLLSVTLQLPRALNKESKTKLY